MDKRVVLASAGAGKTYFIANDFSDKERVYLITFTHRNVENIRKELLKRFDRMIPENIRISTFDSFVYNQLVRPFEPVANFPGIKSRGVEVNIKPSTEGNFSNALFNILSICLKLGLIDRSYEIISFVFISSTGDI